MVLQYTPIIFAHPVRHKYTMTRILVPRSVLEFTITCLHRPLSVSTDRVYVFIWYLIGLFGILM
jgi:hypothetical protein